jgi:hypothetical protein
MIFVFEEEAEQFSGPYIDPCLVKMRFDAVDPVATSSTLRKMDN